MYAEMFVFQRDLDASSRCHRLKTSPSIAESVHNLVDLYPRSFQKSAVISTICTLQLQKFPGIQRAAFHTIKFRQFNKHGPHLRFKGGGQ